MALQKVLIFPMEHVERAQNWHSHDDLVSFCYLSLLREYNLNSRSQLDDYKARKRLLFKRMGLGGVGMCCLIIILSWSQWYFPYRNRKFWSRGLGVRRNLSFCVNHIGFWPSFRFQVQSRVFVVVAKMQGRWRVLSRYRLVWIHAVREHHWRSFMSMCEWLWSLRNF